MEIFNGIKLQKHELKKEGDDFLYFKQLKQKMEDDERNARSDNKFSANLFDEFDYLLVTPDDELFGVKNENSSRIDYVKDAYQMAQDMFVSG